MGESEEEDDGYARRDGSRPNVARPGALARPGSKAAVQRTGKVNSRGGALPQGLERDDVPGVENVYGKELDRQRVAAGLPTRKQAEKAHSKEVQARRWNDKNLRKQEQKEIKQMEKLEKDRLKARNDALKR